MIEVSTYDPRQVNAVAGGSIIQGYAPDTFVEVTRNNDMWMRVTGCDGTTARAKSNDFTGRITLTLMHTSPSNDVLSALAAADELSNAGTFPFALRDANGRTIITALTAWIVKPADVTFGASVGTRQWVIETGKLVMSIGGN